MSKRRNNGFSLLELAIVLVIIGSIAGLSVSVGITQMEAAEISSTKQQLNSLKRAMLLFHEKQGRFPCPADGDIASTSANYGVEAATDCATTTPASITETNGNLIGSIPFKTLNIAEEETIDTWGYRISYMVDKAQTETIPLSPGSIIIQDINGNEILQSSSLGDAIFAFVSHGEDGNGAWPELGGSASCSAGARDSENCDHSADVILTSGTITDTNITANQYDDVIAWYSLAEEVTDGITPFNSLLTVADHICVVQDSSTLWCWGRGNEGSLGIASPPAAQTTPVQVTSVAGNWTDIASDGGKACGINNGRAYCWGTRWRNTIGDGNPNELGQEDVPVEVDDSSKAGLPIPSGAWTDIASDLWQSCGINSGVAYCWGRNVFGQIGDGTNVGDDGHAIANAISPSKVSYTGADNWQMIEVGLENVCGIRGANGVGTLWCWGRNRFGEVDNSAAVRDTPVQQGSDADWMHVTTDDGSVCGIRTDTSLECWGYDNRGQLGDGGAVWPGTPDSDYNARHQVFANGVTHVDVGGQTTCAIHNGYVKCWGNNDVGQLGIGNTTNISSPPTGLAGLAGTYNDFVYVDKTVPTTCAIRDNGEVWCWGKNDHYQFSNGGTTDSSTPVIAAGGRKFN